MVTLRGEHFYSAPAPRVPPRPQWSRSPAGSGIIRNRSPTAQPEYPVPAAGIASLTIGTRTGRSVWSLVLALLSVSSPLAIFTAAAEPFLLPTSNRALFEKGGEEKFFVGTVGKPWTTGTFGCVRSEGWQMHE